MSLFKKAENLQGYLKCGVMGFPGSGKTFTSVEIALGMVKMLGDKRPVFALDTEKGMDYLVEKFSVAGVELQVARTRAFVDLLEAVDEAEANGSLLIIDSITHFWGDVQASYLKANQRKTLTLRDWMPIKQTWARYTEKFLNSKLHIVMAGRAADTFEFFTGEDGKKEMEKTGTKMQAEKNLGYEPGLALEMERVNIGEFRKGVRGFVNRCHVLKDRADILDGQSFDNPTFETFLPHIQKLNLGKHEGLTGKDSTQLFDKSDKDWSEKRKQVEILKEEIEGMLVSYYPGRSADDVKIKTDLLDAAFGTRSWKALDDMSVADLKEGIRTINTRVGEMKKAVADKKLSEDVPAHTKKHEKAATAGGK
jgi:hypothetical protein